MSRPYGILCAIPEELAALATRLDLHAEAQAHGPTRIWRGRLGGAELFVALSGIGKVNAAAAATLLLSAYDVGRLIFCGVAGGLAPDLPVGSVLLADRLAIHDYGLMAAGQFTPTASGIIPIGAPPLTELSPVLAETARVFDQLAIAVGPHLAAPVRRGGVLTGDYFLNCAETRAALRARYGADAIDMESGAVLQIAEAWNTPLYVIRTLSDLAGAESHRTYGEMASMAAHNSALCVPELLALLSEMDAAQGHP
jgi:adenosylhomocysteine nucleosidase